MTEARIGTKTFTALPYSWADKVSIDRRWSGPMTAYFILALTFFLQWVLRPTLPENFFTSPLGFLLAGVILAALIPLTIHTLTTRKAIRQSTQQLEDITEYMSKTFPKNHPTTKQKLALLQGNSWYPKPEENPDRQSVHHVLVSNGTHAYIVIQGVPAEDGYQTYYDYSHPKGN